jgi:hypothetical protein
VLFDPFLSRQEFVVDGAWFRQRELGQGDREYGFDLGAGESIATRRGALFARGNVHYQLRLIGGDHFVLRLGQYAYDAGLVLGPVEAFARVGVTLFDIHAGDDGFGLGFLSPRSGLGISFQVGDIRASVLGFHELQWRWAGGPSANTSGLVFEIGFGSAPRGLPPRYRLASTSGDHL